MTKLMRIVAWFTWPRIFALAGLIVLLESWVNNNEHGVIFAMLLVIFAGITGIREKLDEIIKALER